MNNKTIVSLADSNYFELLCELIESIKRFKESKDIDICILDSGLTAEQISFLTSRVSSIKKAKWDIDIPFYKKGKEWLKSQISRAYLPKYFPNYEKYLWIDCDAWVNSWKCIENYFNACKDNKLGITQSIGPGYRSLAKVNWIFGKIAAIKTQNYKHAECFKSYKSGMPQIQYAWILVCTLVCCKSCTDSPANHDALPAL